MNRLILVAFWITFAVGALFGSYYLGNIHGKEYYCVESQKKYNTTLRKLQTIERGCERL